MAPRTDDLRIRRLRPLLPPAIVMEEISVEEPDAETVAAGRTAIGEVVSGRDPRLLAIVGPCSIHDPAAALEYAGLLAEAAARLGEDLLVVMRVYFEKPRTTVGWKGLINDPHLDESFAINEGLRIARRFLRDVVRLGIPGGTEFLDPITPQFIADLVAWGAIGARTTESQVHRELASGLSMPVGFKNNTRGDVQVAVDAVGAARHPHRFLSVTKQGLAAIVETEGNPEAHVILRGGSDGPNYDAASVADATARLRRADLRPAVLIDCSHANSGKDHLRQAGVAGELADRIAASSELDVLGVMLESFLLDGRQDLAPGRALRHGQSVTDACMGWDRTVPVLERLAIAARKRRARSAVRAVG